MHGWPEVRLRHTEGTSTRGWAIPAARKPPRGPKGKRFDGDYRITEYTPPSRLAFEVVAGPARPTGVFELSEPVPGATTVHFLLDLQPHG